MDGRSTRSQRTTGLASSLRKQILDAILGGEIAQGQVIQIAQLAKRYQTSRTPVREALMSLERAGLITVLPYRGYIIRPITIGEAKDVFFMRTVIEGAAADRAATRLTLEQLGDLWSDEQALAPYTLSFDSACHEFHRKIAEAAGSQRLLDALEEIFNDVQRLQCLVTDPPSPTAIHTEHLAIRDALSGGDGPAARNAMDTHIRALYRHTIEGLQP